MGLYLALALAGMMSLTIVGGTQEDDLRKIADDHNLMRRTVRSSNMKKLTYDPKLECVARRFAGTWHPFSPALLSVSIVVPFSVELGIWFLGHGYQNQYFFSRTLNRLSERSVEFKNHNQMIASDYKECGGDSSGSIGENWYSGAPGDATWAWVEYQWPGKNNVKCSERETWINLMNDRNAARNTTGKFDL